MDKIREHFRGPMFPKQLFDHINGVRMFHRLVVTHTFRKEFSQAVLSTKGPQNVRLIQNGQDFEHFLAGIIMVPKL